MTDTNARIGEPESQPGVAPVTVDDTGFGPPVEEPLLPNGDSVDELQSFQTGISEPESGADQITPTPSPDVTEVGTHSSRHITKVITPVFGNPPPTRSGTGKGIWKEILKPLIDHPGEWAVVQEFMTERGADHAAQNLRKSPSAKPDGRWEFTVRSDPPDPEAEKGRSVLWARFMGYQPGTIPADTIVPGPAPTPLVDLPELIEPVVLVRDDPAPTVIPTDAIEPVESSEMPF